MPTTHDDKTERAWSVLSEWVRDGRGGRVGNTTTKGRGAMHWTRAELEESLHTLRQENERLRRALQAANASMRLASRRLRRMQRRWRLLSAYAGRLRVWLTDRETLTDREK